jgi:hypothetical protein
MKLVSFESLTLQRAHARSGVSSFCNLLHGREGALDNFYLSIEVLSGDFVSPRHRLQLGLPHFEVAMIERAAAWA